jgi:hypothetical protein
MPMDSTLSARTRVGCSPMEMPSRSSRGMPSSSTAMSVVVPPMSRIRASSVWGAVLRMPMTEAAGPEKMDCTGISRASFRGMVPPSALTMLMSAWMLRSFRLCSRASAKALKVRHTAEL